MFFRLAKAGYGSVTEIMEMDVRTVVQALHYESFCADYDLAFIELNKG